MECFVLASRGGTADSHGRVSSGFCRHNTIARLRAPACANRAARQRRTRMCAEGLVAASGNGSNSTSPIKRKKAKAQAKGRTLTRPEPTVELERVAAGDEFDAVVLRDFVGRFGQEYVFVDAGVFQNRKPRNLDIGTSSSSGEGSVEAEGEWAANAERGIMEATDEKPNFRKVRIDGRLKLPNDVKALRKIPSEGKRLRVQVTRVQPSAGRLDVKAVFAGWKTAPRASDFTMTRPLEYFALAEPIENARILQFVNAGILVDAGAFVLDKRGRKVPIPAILFRNELPPDVATPKDLVRKSSVTRVLEQGEEIRVYVRKVMVNNRRLRVSMMPQDPEILSSESELRKRLSKRKLKRIPVRLLHEGAELWGKIASGAGTIKSFGTFVDIGARRNALLHVNDMPKFLWGETWKNELTAGSVVHVKILKVDQDARQVQVALLATQSRLEAYFLREARSKSSPRVSTFVRKSDEDALYEVLSDAVKERALNFMPAELRAELKELQTSPTFVATRRDVPISMKKVNGAEPGPARPAEPEQAEEDEQLEEEDEFDDKYFEDKYGL
ncbi:hypothetical protein FVE85_7962 [Porphyridium purpureum]|uniref:S1 motif domain-containing protein n=1 Tax=Porphyridium purpureum TaxID=35688 RepID=A0A5J4YMS4_PORPP|nr:hypothetical protein FVE85_7962 [Porphyridium purpureum]|eukprot:POR3568..scf295_9